MNIADEFFHQPTSEEYWSESHYLDGIALDEDISFHMRLGFYPNRNTINVFAYIVVGDYVYWLRDEAVPPSNTHGLVVDTDDWRFQLTPVEPPHEWEVVLEGDVLKTAKGNPQAIVAERGERAMIDLEAVITSRHDPFYYSAGEVFPLDGDADRYEVATYVEGTATVDGQQRRFNGVGERDHSWGRRKWAGDAEWLWISGGFDDGTAFNHLSFWLAEYPEQRMINGFWYDGEETHPLTDAMIDENPAFGSSTTRAWMAGDTIPELTLEFEWSEGSTVIETTPTATMPLDWIDEEQKQRGVLNRSPTHQTKEGDISGRGFLENMCQLDLRDL